MGQINNLPVAPAATPPGVKERLEVLAQLLLEVLIAEEPDLG